MARDPQAVREVNERFIQEMAANLVQVMRVSHGVMRAWTHENVADDLRNSLMALDQFPDTERTHGLVTLTRTGDSHGFQVALNLGVLTHFPVDYTQEPSDA